MSFFAYLSGSAIGYEVIFRLLDGMLEVLVCSGRGAERVLAVR